jgi:hypothetical protein
VPNCPSRNNRLVVVSIKTKPRREPGLSFCYKEKKGISTKSVVMSATEEWKVVESYSNYEISSRGNVRRILKTGKHRIRKPRKATDGYLLVDMWQNNKALNRRVHRLVAEAFIPGKLTESDVVDHIDGNRSNNIVENLRWVSPVINDAHRGNGLINFITDICQLRDSGKEPVEIMSIMAKNPANR